MVTEPDNLMMMVMNSLLLSRPQPVKWAGSYLKSGKRLNMIWWTTCQLLFLTNHLQTTTKRHSQTRWIMMFNKREIVEYDWISHLSIICSDQSESYNAWSTLGQRISKISHNGQYCIGEHLIIHQWVKGVIRTWGGSELCCSAVSEATSRWVERARMGIGSRSIRPEADAEGVMGTPCSITHTVVYYIRKASSWRNTEKIITNKKTRRQFFGGYSCESLSLFNLVCVFQIDTGGLYLTERKAAPSRSVVTEMELTCAL